MKNSIKTLREEEMKFFIDNEKKNRSYDLKIRNIEDMEVLLAQMKKQRVVKYKDKSDFVDKAINEKLNKEWKEVYNEERKS